MGCGRTARNGHRCSLRPMWDMRRPFGVFEERVSGALDTLSFQQQLGQGNRVMPTFPINTEHSEQSCRVLR
jgi:hypothetical protein